MARWYGWAAIITGTRSIVDVTLFWLIVQNRSLAVHQYHEFQVK